jgi:PiT family inorganic phosphate transporter
VSFTVLAFFANLTSDHLVLLVICLLAVCLFEAINGFHDTANAVATVIYTKTLKPMQAVVWSGIWNFLGALLGGAAVAMGIVKLMPLMDMAAQPIGENVAMVLAILVTAIAWNLGTWYFGIPCSSSHTLIGALLGAGFAFFTAHGGVGPNWDKAKDIGLALLISPLFGFSLAVLLMFLLRSTIKNKVIFKEPDSKKAPPVWIRAILIATCTLVSYFHGSNDGQKGVGLLMVVLMAFMPLNFALNPDISLNEMKQRVQTIEAALTQQATAAGEHADAARSLANKSAAILPQIDSVDMTSTKEVFALRKAISGLVKNLDTAKKDKILEGATATTVQAESSSLSKTYEFRPIWAVLLISVCLGIGTMFGWKRIVVTIGEKIGKSHLTYAQGASAELCAAATIGVASATGQPVSTTHVLSSAIAGTMVAQGGVKNLQKKTLTSIALAWILTLPVTFVASALLFMLFRLFL